MATLSPDMVIYLTHPQVLIDPDVPVPNWQLSVEGRQRVDAFADHIAAADLGGAVAVVASAERKAVETAAPLAAALGTRVDVRPGTHENDRSSTGFLAPPLFEAQADAFFANPDRSMRGWEAASDAQARILREVMAAEADHDGHALIICGHGAVGTLLYCALAGLPISRQWDQLAGGGCWFAYSRKARRPLARWAVMERLFAGEGIAR